MVDAPPSSPTTPALRRLVPRLFSRTQNIGGFDRLVKTVRKHHPKADCVGI